jgi:integrase
VTAFDARAAKLLPPGEHYNMPDCPGLRFEASATARAWIYRYKSPVDGKMRQVKIGDWPAVSVNAARAEWEKLRDLRAKGQDPAVERRAKRAKEEEEEKTARVQSASKQTVRTLVDFYLTGHVERNRKQKGIDETRRTLSYALRAVSPGDWPGEFGDLDAAKVTRAQAFRLLQVFIETPVQAGRVRLELGATWDYGHDAGKLSEEVPNWWRVILRGKLRSKGRKREGESIGTAKRFLTPAEQGALIRWLPNFSRAVQDLLTLYMWTCARGAEIVTMEVREITEESDGLWWTVPKAKTKNERHEKAMDLRVPLVGRAADVVRRRIAVVQKGYLFPSNGKSGHMEQKVVGVAVWTHQPYSQTRPEQIRPRLPVTHWAPHDLRRTGRTQLSALGCRREVAEAVIGHMPDGIAGVYDKYTYDQERREWLTKLSEHYEEMVRSLQATLAVVDFVP